MALVIVLMGVAGSGKTTIGRELSASLHWRFRDADEFHPAANIAKMAAGIPLTDEDRAPWLSAIKTFIDATLSANENAIVTCSALKNSYRLFLTENRSVVKYVYLKGSRDLLLERLAHRPGHFMKPEMLQSQLDTLEEPTDALVADIAQSPSEIVKQIQKALGLVTARNAEAGTQAPRLTL